MPKRASIERLPAKIRTAALEAIRDGASIDEITETIRDLGGDVSRTAVGRYAKKARDAVRRQQEGERFAEIWVRELGERPEGRTGRLALEMLRTTAMHAAFELGESEEKVPADEINALALALRRIEAAGKSSADRELAIRRMVALEAADKAADAAAKEASAAGVPFSPEALKRIREEVYGIYDEAPA